MICNHDKYTEKRFAMEDIKRIFQPKAIRHLPLQVYYCETCTAWHITTNMVGMAAQIFELNDQINNPNKVKKLNKGLQVAYDKLREKYNNDINDFKTRENNLRQTIINLRNQLNNEK